MNISRCLHMISSLTVVLGLFDQKMSEKRDAARVAATVSCMVNPELPMHPREFMV